MTKFKFEDIHSFQGTNPNFCVQESTNPERTGFMIRKVSETQAYIIWDNEQVRWINGTSGNCPLKNIQVELCELDSD